MEQKKIRVFINGNNFKSNPNGDDSEVLIKALGKGKVYTADWDSDKDSEFRALAYEYSITPLGNDLVEIHSTEDYINSTEYLFEDDYRNPITWGGMVYLQAVELIKKIKEYSVRKPQIWVEEGDHYFAYTMYLKGKTVGEVINKLAELYLEAEANLPANIIVLKKRMLNTK